MTATTHSGAIVAAPGSTKDARGGGPGAPKGTKRREFARALADFPPPEARAEEWRFTPLNRLAALIDGPESDAHLEWETALPAGVSLLELTADDPFLADVPPPADRIAALALDHSHGAVVIRVAAHTDVDEPAVIRLQGKSLDDVVWGHLVIDVEAGASATVVLDHAGTAHYGALVSVLVGDAASLRLVSVQGWDRESVHATHHGIRVGRDAQLRSTQVTFGGDLVRVVETVDFTGPGADVSLDGVVLASGGQHLESRLLIDHTTPHCRSRVHSKIALDGEHTHTVWVGDVIIGPKAEATDTYETNRNLVLSDGARADSVPNLEIETGEVTGAGHASATGRFDDEQLFYCMARGIPADEARRLVVRGFFGEILDHIRPDDLRDRLIGVVDDLLAESASAARELAAADAPGDTA